MKVPPLLKLIGEVVSVRQLLLNRITIILVVVLIGTFAVQGFVGANNDGYVTGQVVTSDGEPVAGAEVTMTPRTLAGTPSPVRTVTDEDGTFEFHDPSLIEFTIEAEHEEYGTSVTTRHHLHFEGQNTEVEIVFNE